MRAYRLAPFNIAPAFYVIAPVSMELCVVIQHIDNFLKEKVIKSALAD